jgi:hypothetical protein
MKTKLVFCAALVAFTAPAYADTPTANQNTIMTRGAQIMPFDMTTAMHMFLPSSSGGVLEVMVHDMDPTQITLVRSHLLAEAAKFGRGDYSDPAYIHGKTMPGLAQLESGASRISIRYFETPTGAAITCSSADREMVSVIHDWLAAQQRDHGSGDMKHCDMKM